MKRIIIGLAGAVGIGLLLGGCGRAVEKAQAQTFANDLVLTGKEDQPTRFTVSDILAHAWDADSGETVRLDSIGEPVNGTITVEGNTYTYLPGPNYQGREAIPFTVVDSVQKKTTANVVINVQGRKWKTGVKFAENVKNFVFDMWKGGSEDGDAIAVWVDTTGKLHSKVYRKNWNETDLAIGVANDTNPATSVQIKALPNGKAVVVWIQNQRLWARIFSGGAWSTETQRLDDNVTMDRFNGTLQGILPGALAELPTIGFNGAGKIAIVWVQAIDIYLDSINGSIVWGTGDPKYWYRTYESSTGWSAQPEKMPSPLQSVDGQTLQQNGTIVDGVGKIYAGAFNQSEQSSWSSGFSSGSLLTPNSAMSYRTPLRYSKSLTGKEMHLGMSTPNGYVSGVWIQSTFTGTIYVDRVVYAEMPANSVESDLAPVQIDDGASIADSATKLSFKYYPTRGYVATWLDSRGFSANTYNINQVYSYVNPPKWNG